MVELRSWMTDSAPGCRPIVTIGKKQPKIKSTPLNSALNQSYINVIRDSRVISEPSHNHIIICPFQIFGVRTPDSGPLRNLLN